VCCGCLGLEERRCAILYAAHCHWYKVASCCRTHATRRWPESSPANCRTLEGLCVVALRPPRVNHSLPVRPEKVREPAEQPVRAVASNHPEVGLAPVPTCISREFWHTAHVPDPVGEDALCWEHLAALRSVIARALICVQRFTEIHGSECAKVLVRKLTWHKCKIILQGAFALSTYRHNLTTKNGWLVMLEHPGLNRSQHCGALERNIGTDPHDCAAHMAGQNQAQKACIHLAACGG